METQDPVVAVVGMSGRFPGARNVDEYWNNLRDGVESLSTFEDDELEPLPFDPDLPRHPDFVKVGGVVDGIELFAPSFFGCSHREAAIMDPQHRLVLECSWEALENAGYDPKAYDGRIGVYAGCSSNTYFINNVVPQPGALSAGHFLQTSLASDKDFLPARVSYKLDLTGPSVNVQTACSTSLVAVHIACQALLNGECDMALAGGASLRVPQKSGYLYVEEGIASPDGHCRPFDADARGTVSGNGVGIVLLKRLEDALAAGDAVRAVIRASAINNDGAGKVGFTAPSIDGQAEVVAEALEMAGVDVETLSYVEAHGTGTLLGDPIEIAALTRAFRLETKKKGFCRIGSVKSNIGHLDAAAGVAGLLKTVLAMEHCQIPPSLHFEQPNPKIDFEDSPFVVNDELKDWTAGAHPLRAGISSLGMGGTNAHIVLEAAPAREPVEAGRDLRLLVLSARSATALEAMTANLRDHLGRHPDVDLGDVAYTLQVGRRAWSHRRALVCRDVEEAMAGLGDTGAAARGAFTEPGERSVAFLFPGQGAQHPGMAARLYRGEPTFRKEVDTCCELLRPQLGLDLRQLTYPDEARRDQAAVRLQETRFTQPALFVVEYALGRLWQEWGIEPRAMLGHSIGEYVAATLAGVMTPADALGLVAQRGRLMHELSPGAMLSVPLSEEELGPLLDERLAIAALNGPSRASVSGPSAAIEELEDRLGRQGVSCHRLRTSHAFHSPMMEPILQPFIDLVAAVDLRPPQIPFLSNLTGTWITDQQATDPSYWSRQLRQPVRFAAGLTELLEDPARVLLEVGPLQGLSALARQQTSGEARCRVVASLPREPDGGDLESMLGALGQLWLAGVAVDWSGFHQHQPGRRLPLPTYPFERRRCWLEPPRNLAADLQSLSSATAASELPASVSESEVPSPDLASRAELTSDFVAPRNALEERLAELWQRCLGVDRLGAHDNYFELGGDSIISLQIVAAASEQGLKLAPRQLFDHPTLAELASVVEQAEESDASALPLTPAQLRLLEIDPGQPLVYEGTAAGGWRWRPELLASSLRQLIRRHPALGLRCGPGNTLRQLPAESEVTAVPFSHVDLERLPEATRSPASRAASRAVARTLGVGLDPEHGPVARAVLLQAGDSGASCLLLGAHPVALDAVSLEILLHELGRIHRRAPDVADKGSTASQFGDWALHLSEHARSNQVRREAASWLSESTATVRPLPKETPPSGESHRCQRRWSAWLEETATRDLLEVVPSVYGSRTEEVLLAALIQAFHGWTGERSLLIEIEGRGRALTFDGLELEHTAGPFATLFPVLLELSEDGSPDETLKAVKERLRGIGEQGVGYGLLRYANGEAALAEKLAARPEPEVLFRYLGRFEVPHPEAEPAVVVRPLETVAGGRQEARRHPLEIRAAVIDGRLRTECLYSPTHFRFGTIQRWGVAILDALRAINDHSRNSESEVFTPSDFPEADLDQGTLDSLMAQLGTSLR